MMIMIILIIIHNANNNGKLDNRASNNHNSHAPKVEQGPGRSPRHAAARGTLLAAPESPKART